MHGTLQSSTLFMASSTSSFKRSALAVSACVFVPEIIDLVACNHLKKLTGRMWEMEKMLSQQRMHLFINPLNAFPYKCENFTPRFGRVIVQHQLGQLLPLLQDVWDFNL